MNRLFVLLILFSVLITISESKKRKCIRGMDAICKKDSDCCWVPRGVKCVQGICAMNSCYPSYHHCHTDSDCCSHECMFYNKLYEWVCY